MLSSFESSTWSRAVWARPIVTASAMIAQVRCAAQGQMSQWGCGNLWEIGDVLCMDHAGRLKVEIPAQAELQRTSHRGSPTPSRGGGRGCSFQLCLGLQKPDLQIDRLTCCTLLVAAFP